MSNLNRRRTVQRKISLTTSAETWIRKLRLAPHPEGGYFRETYRSRELFRGSRLPRRFRGSRSFSTAIYFLLKEGRFSSFHRIKSDELWHFYDGNPLTLHVINRQGRLSRIRLGRNSRRGEAFQAVIKAGNWFGADHWGPFGYSLAGCTVSPGFDFRDFEPGRREDLVRRFPRHGKLIEKLSRF